MKSNPNEVYSALKQVFHEPARMAIFTALSAREEGASFAELKEWCHLTDGNLNRHLKALTEAGTVRIAKITERTRTRTHVYATEIGREQFLHYLRALEHALRQTAGQLKVQETIAKPSGIWELATSGS